MTPSPQEAAYWLHLAYGVDRPTRREANALVLNAHRREGLGLLDLMRLDPRALPVSLAPYADTFAAVQAAEGKIAGQAFIAADLERRRIALLPITSDAYPAHLARRLSPAAAPTVLLVLGDALLLRDPGVAISGSRDAGTQGLAFARACGHALAERGIPVVSGLARGVDNEGLEGALEAGGVVIGIAPDGLLVSRWATDRRLREGLVVISEFPPRQPWRAGAAMARNRTIAGMSRALVVADCVAAGGTTHQVEVHRKLDLPVFVRRGDGEGAMVAELVKEAGVEGVDWSSGPVELPEILLGASASASSPLDDPQGEAPKPSPLGQQRLFAEA